MAKTTTKKTTKKVVATKTVKGVAKDRDMIIEVVKGDKTHDYSFLDETLHISFGELLDLLGFDTKVAVNRGLLEAKKSIGGKLKKDLKATKVTRGK